MNRLAARIHRDGDRHVLHDELVDRFHTKVGECHDPGRAGLLQRICTTEHLDQRWQCLRRGLCQGVGRGIADAGGGVTQSRKHYPRVEPGVIIGEDGAESLDGVLADIGALVVQGLRQ